MGDKPDRSAWQKMVAAARKAGVTACVCSGYRSHSESYGLWQTAPSRSEHWHVSNHARAPNGMFSGGLGLTAAGCRRTLRLPGVAHAVLEAPRWTT